MSPIIPGGKTDVSPSTGPEDKRDTAGNKSPKSGLGAWPAHGVCSLVPDKGGSRDLADSGPAINGPSRLESKTSLVPLLVLLTTEPELCKYSRASMQYGCQAEVSKADLPNGHR